MFYMEAAAVNGSLLYLCTRPGESAHLRYASAAYGSLDFFDLSKILILRTSPFRRSILFIEE